ncbi:hypothetical protein G7054_g5418 [Neopestalotiopsis clavispora]|nr:hypothetical protein G7054_g5418 [Neopestalotiopsis clavispora]
MRLLQADTWNSPSGPTITEFKGENIPKYAILSHVWGEKEVTYQDVEMGIANQMPSFKKIEYTCKQALADGYEYAWIDTCCINKANPAETSESINSMFKWYARADTICYAYLFDCPADADVHDLMSEFAASKWFTRAWTLQELVAPREVVFYSQNWGDLGKKTSLSFFISFITGIDEDMLNGTVVLESLSVAKRMSWAADRQVTIPEDRAYSLMGLFDVNMPTLYGEGEKAFLRLQEEIMKYSDDHSLFAWLDDEASPETEHGLLADSPAHFKYSQGVVPYQDFEPRPPYSLTNRGLRISLHLVKGPRNTATAALNCAVPPKYENGTFLALYLKETSQTDKIYTRVQINQYASVRERGDSQEIYVKGRNKTMGYFLHHYFQLVDGPPPNQYLAVKLIEDVSRTEQDQRPPAFCFPSKTHWKPEDWPSTLNTVRVPGHLSAGIVFRHSSGQHIVVMLGTALNGLDPVVDAYELPHSTSHAGVSQFPSFDDLRSSFLTPSAVFDVRPPCHHVHIKDKPFIEGNTKCHLISIIIHPRHKDILKAGNELEKDA